MSAVYKEAEEQPRIALRLSRSLPTIAAARSFGAGREADTQDANNAKRYSGAGVARHTRKTPHPKGTAHKLVLI
ncbi:hypothetical protein [Phycobacter azelaicus]|uniref:hypothetical protein n=1 Tax=Phycobacter azelaicus TaxID=2668075 RepID=UPI001868E027|nr:hypothetical protein [Phycobacter azelaicus]MBE1295320.1 hypothetical protein [Paracoccaceae bacterium]